MEPNEAIGQLPWKGVEKIFDKLAKVDNANLHHGRRVMNEFKVDIMIRKGIEIKKNTYDMMKVFQHDTCIPHLDFYNEGNMGRLAIPRVGPSFDKWIESGGLTLLFDDHGNTSLLKTMIIDLCDMVEKLGDMSLLIKNLNLKNLYLAAEIAPRILVLITEVEQKNVFSKMEQWKPVKEVIEAIFRKCNTEVNEEAARYLSFIVTRSFNVKSLKRYPHNWDLQIKRDYLFALSAKQSAIRSALTQTGLAWPLVNGKIPEVLDQIIKHQSTRSNSTAYNSQIPLDYVRLIRDTYKHFTKLPLYIKQAFGNTQDGFINCIEKWSLDIWKDIYDIIGWP